MILNSKLQTTTTKKSLLARDACSLQLDDFCVSYCIFSYIIYLYNGISDGHEEQYVIICSSVVI